MAFWLSNKQFNHHYLHLESCKNVKTFTMVLCWEEEKCPCGQKTPFYKFVEMLHRSAAEAETSAHKEEQIQKKI